MPKKKPVVKKEEATLEEIYIDIQHLLKASTEHDEKLKAMLKSSVILGQSMIKLSNHMAKVGAGNVNAQQLRDLIFKRLNVKTGWEKAELKGTINGVMNLLMGK